MARLADQVPAETAESVKRRFLRQNKDLARVNSNYSTRISNLEAKVTSLVSENVDLRHQVVVLEHSRQRWVQRACAGVRAKIAEKFKEIEDILDEFQSAELPSVGSAPESVVEIRQDEEEEEEEGDVVPELEHVFGKNRPLEPLDHMENELAIPSSPQFGEPLECKEPAEYEEPAVLEEAERLEVPNAELLPEIKSGLETVRPRRKRRDSLQEVDIISMVKSQNTGYKVKLSNDPHVSNVTETPAVEAKPVKSRRRSSIVQVDEPVERQSRRKSMMLREKVGKDGENEVGVGSKGNEKKERKALQQKSVNLVTEELTVTGKPVKKDNTIPTAEFRSDEHENERSVSPEECNKRSTGRARKSINYALPSLRTKMRRHQEELVPAVIVLSDHEVDKCGDVSENDPEEIRIKPEPLDDDYDVRVKAKETRKRRNSSLHVAPDAAVNAEKKTASTNESGAKQHDIYEFSDSGVTRHPPALGSRRRSGISETDSGTKPMLISGDTSNPNVSEFEVTIVTGKRRRSMMV
ncbi:hypothetical protein V1512DRAFT_264307 [Lipomyces arxii]|uniref:uncharacterized protein n=1 Tax=Lipomyces arxii TaxID=56418 RepID=UPI0034CE57AD